MKNLLMICFVCLAGLACQELQAEDGKAKVHANFYLDADSDIDKGAEKWANGYFESMTVSKLPVYKNFHQWLKQMNRLYKWRLIKAEEKNNYYFAIYDIGEADCELTFCFRHKSGKDHELSLKVLDDENKSLCLKGWGDDATLVQEYHCYDDKSGEVIKDRELNGYIIRLEDFPRHLRIVATEKDNPSVKVFDEKITNIIDSVRGLEELEDNKMPETNSLGKWVKVVSLPNWKLLKKLATKDGYFAVFKINDKSIAFCRQMKDNPGVFEREAVLKFLDLKSHPLHLSFSGIKSLERRYTIDKTVDKQVQKSRYSIIDGNIYHTKNKFPAKLRIQFSVKNNNGKLIKYFDEVINMK